MYGYVENRYELARMLQADMSNLSSASKREEGGELVVVMF